MKIMQLLVVAVASLFIISCGGGQQNGAAEGVEEADTTIVRPSTYADGASGEEYAVSRVVNEVFYETGTAVSWDGRAINQARSLLSMTVGDHCGRDNCGKQIYLENAHQSQPVRAIVTVPFQIGGSDDYLAREYIIPAGQKTFIGCTHLCDGENIVEFKRAIVVAELAGVVQ